MIPYNSDKVFKNGLRFVSAFLLKTTKKSLNRLKAILSREAQKLLILVAFLMKIRAGLRGFEPPTF
jgi:hypothetical protein